MALIKCPECGREISDKSISCVGCGFPIQSGLEQGGTTKRERDNPEIVLMEGLCNQCSKFFVKNGNAILTNHRFLYLKHSIAKTIAIGVLINMTKGSYEYEIPLSEISKISDGRHGVSKTIVISTKSGDRYEYYVTKREEWKIKLESAVKTY